MCRFLIRMNNQFGDTPTFYSYYNLMKAHSLLNHPAASRDGSRCHVTRKSAIRWISRWTTQITRSGFSSTTNSRASRWLLSLLLCFFRFSSKSRESNKYSNSSFSFPILLLSSSSSLSLFASLPRSPERAGATAPGASSARRQAVVAASFLLLLLRWRRPPFPSSPSQTDGGREARRCPTRRRPLQEACRSGCLVC